VDYKDAQTLRRFMSPHAKILPTTAPAPALSINEWCQALKQDRHMGVTTVRRSIK